MSLCTLPAPVSPEILGMSPTINVVLFVTKTHLILCRKSGQQVWSSRLPSSKPPVSALDWSSDGEVVAVIFEDGSMLAYEVSTGRTIPKFKKYSSDIASVTWSKQIEHKHEGSATKFIDWWQSEDTHEQRLAAVGKTNGSLSIRIYGALIIDDIEIGKGPVYKVLVNEDTGEYAAVSGETLFTVKTQHPPAEVANDMNSFSLREITSNVQTSAQAVQVLDAVWDNLAKVDGFISAMRQDNVYFFEKLQKSNIDSDQSKLNIKIELSTLALTGYLSDNVDDWIKEQHEQGFKKWYKGMSHSWDSLQNTLSEKLIEQTERLILIFGEIAVDCSSLQELLKLLYELTSIVEMQRPIFEREATFVEYVFTEEISRPLALTKLGKVDVAHVIEDLAGEDLLGYIDPIWGSRLKEFVSSSREILNEKVDRIRQQLKEQLNERDSVQLGGNARQIVHRPHGGYVLIVDDNEMVEIGGNHKILRKKSLETTSNLLLKINEEIVALGVNKDSHELLLGEKRTHLDFEPVSVAARFNGTNAIACILSEDCQHYQFIEVPVN